MIIEVCDNGPGIKEEILKNILKTVSDKNRFSKVGLNNVNQRIKLYCGNDYGLEIENEIASRNQSYGDFASKSVVYCLQKD